MPCAPKGTTSRSSRRTAACGWRSAKSADDFIEFALDTSQDEPFAALRVNRSRGRRVVQHERPVKGRTPVDRLSEEDVLQALLDEIAPFVER